MLEHLPAAIEHYALRQRGDQLLAHLLRLFSPVVGGNDDLGIGTVIHFHIKRQSNTVTEARRQVVTDHIVRFLDPLTLALAGKRIGAELRRFTLEDISHIDAEAERAVIEEGNTEVALSALALLVFLDAHSRAGRHILNGKTRDDTKLPYTVGYFFYLVFHRTEILFHDVPLDSVF